MSLFGSYLEANTGLALESTDYNIKDYLVEDGGNDLAFLMGMALGESSGLDTINDLVLSEKLKRKFLMVLPKLKKLS